MKKKNLGFCLLQSIFSKQLKEIGKNIFHGQVEIIIEKLKKFGVQRHTPQSTTDDRYQGEAKSASPWPR
jgi:hypothetical protein